MDDRVKCGLILLWVVVAGSSSAATQTWDVATSWGVTQGGLAFAIDAAKNYFATYPQDMVVLQIPVGTCDIGGNGFLGIDFGNGGLGIGDNGHLVIEGASMEDTTLPETMEEKTEKDSK